MSGHSKWSQIKRKKGVTDEKKGREFSQLSRVIQLAAQKGKDPSANPTLRLLVEKARAANMPNANIERAIKKGAGEEKGTRLEEFLYEAYVPGGAAVLIEGITDSKNRTLSEVRHALTLEGGSLAGAGAVRWLFEEVFVFRFSKEAAPYETLEDIALGGGASTIEDEEESWAMLAGMSSVGTLKEELKKRGFKEAHEEHEWRAKSKVTLSAEHEAHLGALLAQLEERDDVQGVYTNAA